MSFGRIILPIETNQSTIGTHNCVRMKNYLTCTKIASQCGLLSAHINLPAVTIMNYELNLLKLEWQFTKKKLKNSSNKYIKIE